MQSTAPNINALLETTLTTRVYQASRSVPRKVQWRLFVVALIVSDAIMAAIAFRVAYIVRFDLSIPLFKQDAIISLTTYQTLVLWNLESGNRGTGKGHVVSGMAWH